MLGISRIAEDMELVNTEAPCWYISLCLSLRSEVRYQSGSYKGFHLCSVPIEKPCTFVYVGPYCYSKFIFLHKLPVLWGLLLLCGVASLLRVVTGYLVLLLPTRYATSRRNEIP